MSVKATKTEKKLAKTSESLGNFSSVWSNRLIFLSKHDAYEHLPRCFGPFLISMGIFSVNDNRVYVEVWLMKFFLNAAGIYPATHPMLGLQYYACGKLEWSAN